MIDWVVSPVDHKFPEAVEDVKVMDSPSQNVVDPLAVIVGTAGLGFTVTLTAAVEEVVHPNPFATSTV